MDAAMRGSQDVRAERLGLWVKEVYVYIEKKAGILGRVLRMFLSMVAFVRHINPGESDRKSLTMETQHDEEQFEVPVWCNSESEAYKQANTTHRKKLLNS